MMSLNDWLDISSTAIRDSRAALLSGGLSVPIELGLTLSAAHIERGERDCLSTSSHALSALVGPAARVIDCGHFAGLAMAQLMTLLERPKAGVIMTTQLDPRLFSRLRETSTTAQITHIDHDAAQAAWPLETIGAGRTLVLIGGGSFGLASGANAFAMLEHAGQALNTGDYVALTLEEPRDGAVMEAMYRDFGKEIVTTALSRLGRTQAIDPRAFYDPSKHQIRFGGIAQNGASISWNGTRCDIKAGAWLDVGSMTLHAPEKMASLHPDFEVHDHYSAQDKAVTLMLLRKI